MFIVTGHPNKDPTHPDYIPTIFNHTKTGNSAKKLKRFHSAQSRSKRKLEFSTPTPSRKRETTCTCTKDNSDGPTPPETPVPDPSDDCDFPDPCGSVPATPTDSTDTFKTPPTMSTPVSETERKMLYDEMDALRSEKNEALQQVEELKEQLKNTSFKAASIKDNDTKCKHNTGLTWGVFMATFNFLNMFITDKRHRGVSERIDQFFVTLIKLRTGITFDFISIHSNIAKTTLIDIFWKWMDVIHTNLSFLIRSPDPEAVRRTLPHVFCTSYPRLTCIVDCFEIFIDQPKNLQARAKTYSNYKKHNTMKVFIGCTPLGAISFLSSAWGGRVSDIELIRKSGFMNPDLHEPGDQILADRGFPVEEDFAVNLGVQFIIPAFTRGKKQLSAAEVEVSRKLASVRIHIERIIGALKNRYTILQGPLPITMIKAIKDESKDLKLARIDKILIACASLINLGSGIV